MLEPDHFCSNRSRWWVECENHILEHKGASLCLRFTEFGIQQIDFDHTHARTCFPLAHTHTFIEKKILQFVCVLSISCDDLFLHRISELVCLSLSDNASQWLLLMCECARRMRLYHSCACTIEFIHSIGVRYGLQTAEKNKHRRREHPKANRSSKKKVSKCAFLC